MTPRQGWLNANDRVFYRLFLFTFNWARRGRIRAPARWTKTSR